MEFPFQKVRCLPRTWCESRTRARTMISNCLRGPAGLRKEDFEKVKAAMVTLADPWHLVIWMRTVDAISCSQWWTTLHGSSEPVNAYGVIQVLQRGGKCREEERLGNERLAEKSGPRLAVQARPCTALVMTPSRERHSFPKCGLRPA
jgi:hypothetical protein